MRRPSFRDFLPLWKQYVDNRVVWWKGDPQVRTFLPMFWMKLVKPSEGLPPDVVLFHVHKQMSKFDIKEYLEKIYKVPVLTVATAVHRGAIKNHPSKGYHLEPEDDYKVAYVQLADGVKFEFPDIFKEKQTDEQRLTSQIDNLRKEDITFAKGKGQIKGDLPFWFR